MLSLLRTKDVDSTTPAKYNSFLFSLIKVKEIEIITGLIKVKEIEIITGFTNATSYDEKPDFLPPFSYF